MAGMKEELRHAPALAVLFQGQDHRVVLFDEPDEVVPEAPGSGCVRSMWQRQIQGPALR